MKYSTKLALFSTGVILVSILVIVYFGNRMTARIMEDQIKENLEEDAFHTMDSIDRMFFERYSDMKLLAGDPLINSRASTPVQITERLTEFRNIYRFYASISMFDLNRIRIADTVGKNINDQHPFSEYWPGIAEGRDFVMVISKSQTLNTIVIYFASIVRDKKGKPFGVVVSRMPVERLHEIIGHPTDAHAIGKDVRTSLVDKDGLLLYSNFMDGILKDVSPDWGPVKRFMTAGTMMGSARHQFLGEEEISTFAREQGYLDFKGNDWTLIMCVPTKTAFAAAHEMIEKMAAVLFVIGIFVLLIVVILSRMLSKPVERLSAAAIEIGKGNLDVAIDISSRDEIGRLARTFNTMAADLKKDSMSRKKAEEEREKLVVQLQSSLEKIKTLRGLIPICASCKRVRNDKGYWTQVEAYVSEHSLAEFSHGMCPECMKKMYPDYIEKAANDHVPHKSDGEDGS